MVTGLQRDVPGKGAGEIERSDRRNLHPHLAPSGSGKNSTFRVVGVTDIQPSSELTEGAFLGRQS